jgi:hypothetical protein
VDIAFSSLISQAASVGGLFCCTGGAAKPARWRWRVRTLNCQKQVGFPYDTFKDSRVWVTTSVTNTNDPPRRPFPRQSLAERLLAFTRIKLPAWLVLLLLIFHQIPGWKDDIDFWIDVAKHSGGFFAVIAAAISSPFFTPILAVAAVIYLVVVGQPKSFVQRHPAWAVLGWSVFVVCASAIAVTAISGFYELKLREAHDQGAAGIPRNTPDVNSPARPQTPLYTDNWGSITPDQVRILLQELPKLKPASPTVRFSSVPNDNEGYSIWLQFDQIFKRSGIDAPRLNEIPRGPEEEGLMLAVHDPNNIPLSAQKLREAFAIANIPLRVIVLPEGLVVPQIEFVIFIGPHPIRWR